MDMGKYYLNTNTGEITDNHYQAILWYRQGIKVEIYKHNKKVLTWEI